MENANEIKELHCSCVRAGTLIINNWYASFQEEGIRTSTSGNLADYTFTSKDTLFKVAQTYDYIIRPNSCKIAGIRYTLKMASNDFKKHASFKEKIL